jgi:hypothetical protein
MAIGKKNPCRKIPSFVIWREKPVERTTDDVHPKLALSRCIITLFLVFGSAITPRLKIVVVLVGTLLISKTDGQQDNNGTIAV